VRTMSERARALIDPDLLATGEPAELELSASTLGTVRAAMSQAPWPQPAGLSSGAVSRSTRVVPGRNGEPEVSVIVFEPSSPTLHPRPTFLHIHGGGYVLGVSPSVDTYCAALADELGALVVSVDYRLAPETSYPGPLNDCLGVLEWLVSNDAADLSVDFERIAVGGESAGAGIAAALALYARDHDGPRLCFQSLNAPMLDDRTVTRVDVNPWVGQLVWTNAKNDFGWSAYLGAECGSDDVSPYAAAARSDDLGGLPPTLIQVGSLDLFLEEDIDYARRLLRAGVSTELHVYPGAYHGFETFAPDAPVSRAARFHRFAALRRTFNV
jgi:acetyl esterase/lipase